MPEPGSCKAACGARGLLLTAAFARGKGAAALRGRIAALANPELGAKQICPNCSAKFYDLNRRPALCPKCGESFDPEEAVRNRRVRARVATPDYEADEEAEEKPKAAEAEPDEGFEEDADDPREIDLGVAAEVIDTEDDDVEVDPAAPPPPADDLGVDFAEDEDLAESDDDDSVPFLEDEDEDDFDESEIEGLPDEGDDDR
jgi:uncharacterized protein (TIGR02300 family)